MLQQYTVYDGVSGEYLKMFEYYWDKYENILPALPSNMFDEKNRKAAVLNGWIGISTFNEFKLLKLNRTFSHSIVGQLFQKIESKFTDEHLIRKYRDAYELHFLYSYFIVNEVIELVEPYIMNNLNEVNPYTINYYKISDDELFDIKLLCDAIKKFNSIIFTMSDFEIEALLHVAERNLLRHVNLSSVIMKEFDNGKEYIY